MRKPNKVNPLPLFSTVYIGATTISIMTFIIITRGLFVTLSIMALDLECCYAEFHYAECYDLLIIMLNLNSCAPMLPLCNSKVFIEIVFTQREREQICIAGALHVKISIHGLNIRYQCYKTFCPSSLMTRPNKIEGLPLETLSSQALEFEGKARANPIGGPFRCFLLG